MTGQTKTRALKALTTAKSAGEKCFFPMCFVCGEHVFFTFMAAVRQQRAYKFIEGKDVLIEVVHTQRKNDVNWDIDQKGMVQPAEIFPYKEYRMLTNLAN